MELPLVKAIITAMPSEANMIIEKYQLQQVKKFNNITVYEGDRERDGEKEKIVLVVSGIGKIQAAIATTYVFENYDVFKLINIGIA
jgi:adenosylhomocysteine nucleosidase